MNWIIAGLGNPGPQYEATRHNVGFWLLDQLAHQLATTFSVEAKFNGQVAQGQLAGHKVFLLKPQLFMNRSGQSVAALANFYKIPLEHILIVHDELDLPAGTVRLKRTGGHGGHNGLRNIIECLGGKTFLRCRLGIDHPGDSRRVADYVLSKPKQTDRELIEQTIDQALIALPDVVSGELEKAMQWLHSQ